MNSKNILYFIVLIFMVNTYTVLAEEVEEKSSNDKFTDLLMTTTLPSKTLPTNNVSSKTQSNIITVTAMPEQIVKDKNVPMKTVTFPILQSGYSNFSELYNITTTVPADVDGVYNTCINLNLDESYKIEMKSYPYLCHEDLSNCYTFNENYYTIYTGTKTYGSSTSIFSSRYNCNFYTKRNNDPTPTATEDVNITKMCFPTVYTQYPYGIDSQQIYYSKSVIEDEEQPDLETQYESIIRKYTYFNYASTYTMCSTKQKYPNTGTVVATPSPKPYKPLYSETELSESQRIVYPYQFDNELYSSSKRPSSRNLPSNVQEYAVNCDTEYRKEHSENYYRRAEAISNTSTSTSRRVKTVPSTSSTVRTIPSSTTSTATLADAYCEKDGYCFNKYTEILASTFDGIFAKTYRCTAYTHQYDEPVTTAPITTSYCKPTSTLLTKVTSYILDEYGTTITNGFEETIQNYIVYTTQKIGIPTTFCKEDITTTTTTTTTKKTTTTTTTKKTTTTTTRKSTTKKTTTTTTTKKTTTTTTKKTTTKPIETEAVDDSKCADKWAQCGGLEFKGPTCCKSGLKCHELNPYYFQCY